VSHVLERRDSMYEWLGIILVLVIAEVLTTNLVFASFAIGAACAAITAALTDSLLMQVISFGIMSVVSLAAVRPVLIKRLYHNSGAHVSGLNGLIGQVAVASSQINTAAGEILINGDTWTARTTGISIPIKSQVVIVSINGAIAIVEFQSKE